MEDAQTNAEKRKAKERKEDLMRLKRAEQIYVSHIITYLPPLIAKLSVGIRLPSFPQYQVGSLYYSSSYLQLFLQARICRSLNPLPPLSFLPGYHVLAFFWRSSPILIWFFSTGATSISPALPGWNRCDSTSRNHFQSCFCYSFISFKVVQSVAWVLALFLRIL